MTEVLDATVAAAADEVLDALEVLDVLEATLDGSAPPAPPAPPLDAAPSHAAAAKVNAKNQYEGA